jgi:hypothetical protein
MRAANICEGRQVGQSGSAWSHRGLRPAPLRSARWFAAGLGAVLVAGSAHGQFEGYGWLPTLGTVPTSEVIATWAGDPDGPGPMREELFASTTTQILRWAGTYWVGVGGEWGMSGVRGFWTLDIDGPGPEPLALIAFPTIASPRGTPQGVMARWNGSGFEPVAAGVTGTVWSATMCDLDGAGPLPSQVIVGGEFTRAGEGDSASGGGDGSSQGISVANIAAWNGRRWQSVGAGFNGVVRALVVADVDGVGPQPSRLVAGGAFTSSGTQEARRLATFDGETWSTLGGGTGGTVAALAMFDADGAGPQESNLFVGGSFTEVGGMPAIAFARWKGDRWETPAVVPSGSVSLLKPIDRDGAGPIPERLAIGREDSSSIELIFWDSLSRLTMFSAINASEMTIAGVSLFDFDGQGPDGSEVVLGGRGSQHSVRTEQFLLRTKAGTWQPLFFDWQGDIATVKSFDPDAAGPQQPVLVVGGAFESWKRRGATPWSYTAVWRNGSWGVTQGTTIHGVTGVNAIVKNSHVFDADGDGPAPARWIVSGHISQAGSAFAERIAAWNGTSWSALGQGLTNVGTPAPMTTMDVDGAGPQPPVLVVSGSSFFGGSTQGPTRIWNGTTWTALPATGAQQSPQSVVAFDLDGPGPEGPSIIVASRSSESIKVWNGSVWSNLSGGNLPGQVFVFDEDGPGLAEPVLALLRDRVVSTYANRIWTQLWNRGVAFYPEAVTIFDPDGSGPVRPYLVGAGSGSWGRPEVQAKYVARWNGRIWIPIGTYIDGVVKEMTSFDPDGDGPIPPRLVLVGNLRVEGQYPMLDIAMLGPTTPPSPCGRADMGGPGASFGPDGMLDQNDFVMFLQAWFANEPLADLGGPMSRGEDGFFDGSDIVLFVEEFFEGSTVTGCLLGP